MSQSLLKPTITPSCHSPLPPALTQSSWPLIEWYLRPLARLLLLSGPPEEVSERAKSINKQRQGQRTQSRPRKNDMTSQLSCTIGMLICSRRQAGRRTDKGIGSRRGEIVFSANKTCTEAERVLATISTSSCRTGSRRAQQLLRISALILA